MRNEFAGKLKFVSDNPAAGGGSISEALQPDSGREWVLYALYVANTDGASRDLAFRIYDGSDFIRFPVTSVANGGKEILSPFTTKSIRLTNAVYGQVWSGDTWSDKSNLTFTIQYADIGGK